MTLAEYLRRNNLDTRGFVKLLHKHFPDNQRSIYAVRKWRNKSRKPDLELILQIEHLTKGKVKPEDWTDQRRRR